MSNLTIQWGTAQRQRHHGFSPARVHVAGYQELKEKQLDALTAALQSSMNEICTHEQSFYSERNGRRVNRTQEYSGCHSTKGVTQRFRHGRTTSSTTAEVAVIFITVQYIST